jgi:hypothetical protein
MKQLFILSVILSPAGLFAQNVSVSPVSFQGWGITEYAGKASVEYGVISSVTIFITPPEKHTYVDKKGLEVERFFSGLFLSPLRFDSRVYGRVGAGLFHRPFPNANGQRLNFLIELGVKLHKHISLSYSHISNFDIGRLNPGVDHINLKIHINP